MTCSIVESTQLVLPVPGFAHRGEDPGQGRGALPVRAGAIVGTHDGVDGVRRGLPDPGAVRRADSDHYNEGERSLSCFCSFHPVRTCALDGRACFESRR